jgi:hypothetical protein
MLWQNRPIYKSISTIATTEAVKSSYLSTHKPDSPPSVTKNLGKHNQNRMIKQIHITYMELQRK